MLNKKTLVNTTENDKSTQILDAAINSLVLRLNGSSKKALLK